MLQHFSLPRHSLSLPHSTRQMLTRLGSSRGQKPLLAGGDQQGQSPAGPCPFPPPTPGVPTPRSCGQGATGTPSPYTRGAESGGIGCRGHPRRPLGVMPPTGSSCARKTPDPAHSWDGAGGWRGCRPRSPRWLQSVSCVPPRPTLEGRARARSGQLRGWQGPPHLRWGAGTPVRSRCCSSARCPGSCRPRSRTCRRAAGGSRWAGGTRRASLGGRAGG